MKVSPIELDHSTNNILYSSQKSYTNKLIKQSEKFFQRLNNHAFFKTQKNFNNSTRQERYGLKSLYKATDVDIIKPFECEWFNVIKNIKFRKKEALNCKFQKNLKRQVKKMTKSDIILKSDKTNNYYDIKLDDYNKIVEREVHKHYKKCKEQDVESINNDIEKFGEVFGVHDRVKQLIRSECFIQLKDHKPNWEHKLPARLINPSKSDLGVMSKYILDKILKTIKSKKSYLNQCISTDEALEWFNQLPNRYTGIFTFDIESYYPSITQETLEKALDFASSLYNLERNERDVIMAARKSILFFQGEPWCKKGDTFFDVTMGCPDGAEICELVGLFLLEKLHQSGIIDSSEVILYRDDGVGVIDGNGSRCSITAGLQDLQLLHA